MQRVCSQVDGRVLEDQSKRAMSVADFVRLAGLTTKRPLRAILLQASGHAGEGGDEGTSLETLLQMHGSIDVAARAANAQADPHCTLCGGGESEAGNEILLCDGWHCVGCFHQQCVDPPVLEVPEGTWLCQTCVANDNIIDPEIEEDERKAEECAGGEERMVVLCNDGVGEQDIPLLSEVTNPSPASRFRGFAWLCVALRGIAWLCVASRGLVSSRVPSARLPSHTYRLVPPPCAGGRRHRLFPPPHRPRQRR